MMMSNLYLILRATIFEWLKEEEGEIERIKPWSFRH